MTDCTQESFEFPPVKRRKVEATFSGGEISSDGGVVLNFGKRTNRDELEQFFETITDDPTSVTPVSEAAFCRARQKLNSTLSYFRLPPEASSQGVLSSSVSFMNDAGNTIWRWLRSW